MRLAVLALLVGCASPHAGDSATHAPAPTDADDDGYALADDCNDSSAEIHPNATEHCDGIDEDCDKIVDDDAIDALAFYADVDGDGYGAGKPTVACDAPAGFVRDATDCDDGDASINPKTEWYDDADADGYGSGYPTITCVAPDDTSRVDGDCDETRADVHPGAVESCDEVDNDCDKAVDEDAMDATAWYTDADGDGFGDPATVVYACEQPPSTIAAGFDCDDTSDAIAPLSVEECDDLADTDCSGRPSNGCDIDALGASGWSYGAAFLYDGVGYSVASAGDMDGDGMDDFVVGAPYRGLTDDTVPDFAGGAYVVRGNTSPTAYGDITTIAAAVITGDDQYDETGSTVEGIGDVDGDGNADILVSSINRDASTCADCGDVRLFYGPVSGALGLSDADVEGSYDVPESYFGSAAAQGDFDGDGQSDVVVGSAWAPNTAGAVESGMLYFFAGPPDPHLDYALADATLDGEDGSWATTGLTSLRDVDGDGIADLGVGVWGKNAYDGEVLVFDGPIAGALTAADADVVYTPRRTGDQLGYRCEWAGDMDGDGTVDLATTAYGADDGATNAGVVYVVYGPLDTSMDMGDADGSMLGSDAPDAFGVALTEGADLDGDGFDDLVIGDNARDDAGYAYVFYGPVHGPRWDTSADYVLQGAGIAGQDVDVLDFDGDSALDLLVGAPDAGGFGAAYVVSNTSF